jgi:hypothetical protein
MAQQDLLEPNGPPHLWTFPGMVAAVLAVGFLAGLLPVAGEGLAVAVSLFGGYRIFRPGFLKLGRRCAAVNRVDGGLFLVCGLTLVVQGVPLIVAMTGRGWF